MTTTLTAAAAVATIAVLAACGNATQPTTSLRPLTQPATSTPTSTASCHSHSGFELSLVSDRGGQPTPVRASEWFARHGGMADVPRDGWRVDGSDQIGVFTRSGSARLHAIQGPDKTWQVDSGTSCR
jgi:hypothetical protein